MNILKNRAVEEMLELIEDFEQGKIAFQWLVYKLAKIMETGEVSEGEPLRRCYKAWEPLKEFAIQKIYEPDFDKERIQPCLDKMKLFLVEQRACWTPLWFFSGVLSKNESRVASAKNG